MYFKNPPHKITEAEWKELIEQNTVVSIIMNFDNTIEVQFLTAFEYKGSNLCGQQFMIYDLDQPSAKSLLKVIGPFKPGYIDTSWQKKEVNEEPFHNVRSPKEVSKWLERKEIRKAVMRENRYIELWGYLKQEKCFTFSGEEYSEVIEKYTGPMDPGDEFYFQKDDN